MEISKQQTLHKLANLFIHTPPPCNDHTTASGAMWAALPVLTRMGESVGSRVAASLNNVVEMQVITSLLREYEKLAVAFNKEAHKGAALKEKLNLKNSHVLCFNKLRLL
jgi:protein O-GlcNAc transferase